MVHFSIEYPFRINEVVQHETESGIKLLKAKMLCVKTGVKGGWLSQKGNVKLNLKKKQGGLPCSNTPLYKIITSHSIKFAMLNLGTRRATSTTVVVTVSFYNCNYSLIH